MDQTTQPQGNFKMNLNFARGNNSKAPAITGTISTPENPDREFDFAAFAHEEHDKQTGEVKTYFIGPVTSAATMREALAQKKEYGAHFITVRPNQFKVFETLEDGTPNPAYAILSDAERKKEDAKPSWWGKWTRSGELPVLDVSAWDREPSRYGPWASGNTQHHLAKNQEVRDAEPTKTGKRARSQEAEMSR